MEKRRPTSSRINSIPKPLGPQLLALLLGLLKAGALLLVPAISLTDASFGVHSWDGVHWSLSEVQK